ncbi:MAG: hypothetical protein HYY06_20640 [Deltaproteobacteria bacterium]|nr:hypothetical protein [Deltaproteobacteria bacterium]
MIERQTSPAASWSAVRYAALLALLSMAGCSRGDEPTGVLPNAQRAGEVARASTVAKAFLEIYPDAVPEAAADRCENELGMGRACDGPEHYDVTFTHTEEGTPPRVTRLTVEIGRGETVMGSIPSSLLVYQDKACVEDTDCLCAPCTACFNVVHAPAKIAAQAADCVNVACAANGCACRGGICRTR